MIRKLNNKKGFTLVELLVVIGIIALLISILLPALNKARNAAKIVTCGAQMHGIVLGLIQYAGDNRGFLPTSDGYPGSFTPNATFNTNILSTSKPPVGLGQLVKPRTYITAKTLICPGQPDGSVFADRSNYLYNPHPATSSSGSGETVRWKKLNKVPNDRCLLMDIIYSQGTLCHYEPTIKAATWNVAFKDGSVRMIKSPEVTANIIGRGGQGGKWTRLNDWVRALELLSTGSDAGNPIPWGGDRLYPWVTEDPN